MSLIAREPKGNDIAPLAPGVYMAKCYLMADIGEQYNKMNDSWKTQIIIGWEIEDEYIEIDGQNHPRTMHKYYTNSLHKNATLRAVLETWRGRPFTSEELEGFDLRNIVGAGCQLQIEHKTKENGDIFANIKAIMALPRGMKLSPPSQRICFDMDTDLGKLETMPKVVQNAVAKSRQMMQPEEEKPFGDAPVFGDMDELDRLLG